VNQKLSDWASIAEILSGIAVLITLVFLIIEIRENTEVTRAAAYDRNIDSINESAYVLAQNPELARIYRAFVEGRVDDLDSDESFRVQLMVRTLFRIYEKAYFAYQYGTLGEAEWTRFSGGVCRQIDRADAAMWDIVKVILTEEFVGYLTESCIASH